MNLERFFCWFVFELSLDDDEEEDDDEDEEDEDDDLDDEPDELFERLLSGFSRFSLFIEFLSSWLISTVERRWMRSFENLYVFFVL